MKSYTCWSVEKQSGVVRVCLDREADGDSFSAESMLELEQLCAALEADAELKIVVFAAKGRHFSCGMSLDVIKQITRISELAFGQQLKRFQAGFDAVERLNKIKIAEIQGFCIGAGMILASCCDFRYASTKSIFALPEIKIGIGVIMGTTRITNICGMARTKEMILFGEKFNAKKALENAFIHEVVEPARLREKTDSISKKLCNLPFNSLLASREMIERTACLESRAAQDLEIELQKSILKKDDFLKALNSYAEKRARKK